MDSVLVRAQRAFQRGPRYVVARLSAPIARRARQPWSRVYPRLFTERALLRSLDAESIDELWNEIARQPFLLDASRRTEYVDAFNRAYPSQRDVVMATADR